MFLFLKKRFYRYCYVSRGEILIRAITNVRRYVRVLTNDLSLEEKKEKEKRRKETHAFEKNQNVL